MTAVQQFAENFSAGDLATWAKAHKAEASQILSLRKAANDMRRMIDEIHKPVLASFGFVAKHSGQPITKSSDLYLVSDSEIDRLNQCYAAINEAVSRHGYDTTDGTCPALKAEFELSVAERDLIEDFRQVASFPPVYRLEDRQKLLTMLVEISR